MRKKNWIASLAAVIASAREKAFEWGQHDCCLFASDCAIAVCGVDPAEAYRGRYQTEIGAKRALTRQHGSIEAAFDACFVRISPPLAQRGDIVLIKSEMGMAAGVVWTTGIWSVSPQGTGPVELEPLVAWRVE
ncbi:hypothetical protein ACPD0N_003194 [Vibrio cholerae]